MNLVDVLRALQTAAKAAIPFGVDYVPENTPYVPGPKPYVRAFVIPAQPANPTMGAAFHREQGVFQLTLNYPAGAGMGAVLDLAERIKAALPRGLTLPAGTGTVLIFRTAYVGPSQTMNDRISVPVRLNWQADVIGPA